MVKQRVLEMNTELLAIKSFLEFYVQEHLSCSLEQMHSCFDASEFDGDIRSISRQEACNFLYEIMPDSKNYNARKAKNTETFFGCTFSDLYRNFVAEAVKLTFPKDTCYFQRNPTIRVQFPKVNTSSIKHRDADFGHPLNEINFWVPLTKINKTTNLWFDVNDKEYCEDLKMGQLISFDGDILHFTKKNLGQTTRVSFDFRLLLESDYHAAQDANTIAQGLSFKTDYYKLWEN